jgi:hypothetical protein
MNCLIIRLIGKRFGDITDLTTFFSSLKFEETKKQGSDIFLEFYVGLL